MDRKKISIRNNKRLKQLDKWLGNLIILGIYPWAYLASLRRDDDDNSYKNILLVKLAAVGDTVLLIPAIRAVRRKFPQARVSIIVTRINYEIIKNCPYLDDVLVFEPQRCVKNPIYFFSFARSLKNRRFDLYIDFEQWSRITPLLGYFSGIKRRVGFGSKDKIRSLLYTTKLAEDSNQHEVKRFLELVGLVAGKIGDDKLQLWVPQSAKDRVRSIFKQHRLEIETDLIVAIHPGCGGNHHPRNWDKEKYVKLCNYLIDKHKAKIIITGTVAELNLVEWIAHNIDGDALTLAGSTSLDELVEVISGCDLLICGNTGAMHIASAVGTSTIALHGPTNPLKWGPWGEGNVVVRKDLPCSPCLFLGFEYACQDFNCMRLIEVEDVQQGVDKLLTGIIIQKKQNASVSSKVTQEG